MEVTAGEGDSTAAVAEDFTAVGEEGFTGVQVSTLATLGTAADTTTADIVAATPAGAEVTAGAAGATAGAEDLGGEDTVTDGVGDLALGGHIGVGDIPMPTTTRGITRPTLIILTRTTVLRTTPPVIRILTTGTTILHRQIPARGPNPTRTDPQDPGDPRYQEAQRARTTQTAMSRPLRLVRRFSPLTA
jgi:hypothetical protein